MFGEVGRDKPRHDLRYTRVHVSQPCLLTQSPCVAVAYPMGPIHCHGFLTPMRHEIDLLTRSSSFFRLQ
jgi:hypothetical protein